MRSSRLSSFYTLVKTHKLSSNALSSNNSSNFKVRSIISKMEGGAPIGFLGLLASFSQFIPSYFTSTNMFLDKIGEYRFRRNYVIESLDLTPL